MVTLAPLSPVTPADLKRAAYFGLRIPAPAPAVEPAEVDPGDSWDTWVDDGSTWELGPDPEPDDAEPYHPTAEESAWWAGFCLGAEGEDAGPPAELVDRPRVMFVAGRQAAWMESQEYLDWRADMAALRDRVEGAGPVRDEDVYRPGCAS